MKQDDPKLVFWSKDQWTAAQGSVHAIRDSYWLTDGEGRIALYKVGRDLCPQCNQDLRVAEYVRDRTAPWAQIRKVDLVLVPSS